MMRLKTYLLLAVLLVLGQSLRAQQVPHFTQYQFVGLAYNPAFAGSDSYFNAFAIHRSQWAGIADAPRTYQLGMHAPSRSGKMGFGGNIYTDVVGPTRRFGAQGVYAYHLDVSANSKVSLGASFGVTQFTIDGSQIVLREAGDQALTNNIQSELTPDASFGVLWYSDKFRLGVSANQILNNDLDLFPGDGEGRLAVHYYLMGSYRFDLNDDFAIEPAALLKYVAPFPVQVDATARFIYKGNLWLGGSYRSNDAAAVFAGYNIMDYLSIGYSYDITTSDISDYTDGTHEILLSLRFGKDQLLE
jgi:type IX secretion system PorP/SprF family membrane protein